MNSGFEMKKFERDIAISLCHEDVHFAHELKKALNPKLNIFFYETDQDALVGKKGFEKFYKVFREEARLVIVLYREKWGKSLATEIEEQAIIDRSSKDDEGVGFVLMFKMDETKPPFWYTPGRIYADPNKSSLKELAAFCELRVTELGGEVTPLTFEEKVDFFHQEYDARVEKIRYLQDNDCKKLCIEEMEHVIRVFSQKDDYLRSNTSTPRIQSGFQPLALNTMDFNGEATGHLDLFKYRFAIQFIDEFKQRGGGYRRGSQQITMVLYTVEFPIKRDADGKVLEQASYRFNLEGDHLRGWSLVEQFYHNKLGDHRQLYLKEDDQHSYILNEIIPTEKLIDQWLVGIINRIDNDLYEQPFLKKSNGFYTV